MYKDAIELFAKSGTTYTPTLLVQYGGPWAENWWYEHHDILSDAKLTHFTPFSELERRALRRPQWFRDSEYSFKLFAEQAKKIVEAGGASGWAATVSCRGSACTGSCGRSRAAA